MQKFESLRSHKLFQKGQETEAAINRSVAILKLASGATIELECFSNSDLARIYSTLASRFADHKKFSPAKSYFLKSLSSLESIAEKDDLANRAIAVAGNNLAHALEELRERNPDEIQLMLLAAVTSRKYWEIAGTWLEVEKAEYRLAQSYLKAGLKEQALKHAEICLKICMDNGAAPSEMAFAKELMDKIHGV